MFMLLLIWIQKLMEKCVWLPVFSTETSTTTVYMSLYPHITHSLSISFIVNNKRVTCFSAHINAHTCSHLKPCRRLQWNTEPAPDLKAKQSVRCDISLFCLSLPCLLLPRFSSPALFHQLSPSFDTSEGVPHMPVTSPLLHQHFLPCSLLRACVSVWNLCTL